MRSKNLPLKVARVVLLAALVPGTAASQTSVNPDVSVVGDTRVEFRTTRSAAVAGSNEVEFVFEEIEFDFNAYLNPYMRADAFVGLHGTEGPVELEEAVITVLRGLPWGLQARGGRYLLDFGKINTQHSHQWSWLNLPLAHAAFLGSEGAGVTGLNFSLMHPVGESAVTLSANAFEASAIGRHDEAPGNAGDKPKAAPPPDSPGNIGISVRSSVFRSFLESWSGEVGASALYAEYDPEKSLVAVIVGVDSKFKWRPDAYRSFSWVTEWMLSDREFLATPEALSPGMAATRYNRAWGTFSAVELQFRKRFDTGAFLDYSQDVEFDGMATTGAGAFFGFLPAEHTARFSVIYRAETSDLYPRTAHEVTFQVVWAMGPHKPHAY